MKTTLLFLAGCAIASPALEGAAILTSQNRTVSINGMVMSGVTGGSASDAQSDGSMAAGFVTLQKGISLNLDGMGAQTADGQARLKSTISATLFEILPGDHLVDTNVMTTEDGDEASANSNTSFFSKFSLASAEMWSFSLYFNYFGNSGLFWELRFNGMPIESYDSAAGDTGAMKKLALAAGDYELTATGYSNSSAFGSFASDGSMASMDFRLAPVAVPEPGTFAVALGLAALALLRTRNTR